MGLFEAALVTVLVMLSYLPAITGQLTWDCPNVLNEPALARPLFGGHFLWLRLTTRASWKAVWRVAQKLRLPHVELQHTMSVLLHIGTALSTAPLAVALDAEPLIVALAVGLHPLATAAVAQIGQRASILSWLLALSGLNVVLWFGIYGTPLALICWGAALMAKEDTFGALGLLGLLTKYREYATTLADKGYSNAGVATRLPLKEHFPRAVVGSMERIPMWFIGLGQSIEHRTPTATWKEAIAVVWFATAATAVVVHVGHAELALLFWLSPLVLYWFLPTAHILAEPRAYATVTLFALIVGLLPAGVATVLLLLWSCQTAARCYIHGDPVRFWRSCLKRGTKFTVWTNLAAALQQRGQFDEAAQWNAKLIAEFPLNGLAYANQGLIEQAKAVELYSAAGQVLEQTGLRGDEYQQFQTAMQRCCQLLVRARQLTPEDAQVKMHHDNALAIAKHLRVKVLVPAELLH